MRYTGPAGLITTSADLALIYEALTHIRSAEAYELRGRLRWYLTRYRDVDSRTLPMDDFTWNPQTHKPGA